MIKKSITLLLSGAAFFSMNPIYSEVDYTVWPGEDHHTHKERIDREYEEEERKKKENQRSAKYNPDIEIAKRQSVIDETVRKLSKYTGKVDEFLNRKVWEFKGRRSIYDYFETHFDYKKNPYELIIYSTDYALLAVGSSSSWDALSDKQEVVEALKKQYYLLKQSVDNKFDILPCKKYLNEKQNEEQKNIVLKALMMEEVYHFLSKKVSDPSIKEENPGNENLDNIINKAKSKSEGKILREIQIIMYYLTKAHQNTLNSYINQLYKR